MSSNMFYLASLCLMVMKFESGQALPTMPAFPALQAGQAAFNMLPPSAQTCVKKVGTEAVSRSVANQLATQAGQLLPGVSPTIVREPGQIVCKGGVPYYRERTHLKFQLAAIPLDIPFTTEKSLSDCMPGQLGHQACGLLGGGPLGALTGNNANAGVNQGPLSNLGGGNSIANLLPTGR